MHIRVNGETKELPETATLSEILNMYGLKGNAVVLELNCQVVQKNAYDTTRVREGDALEIVHFVGGG